jgi:hypothetical protein
MYNVHTCMVVSCNWNFVVVEWRGLMARPVLHGDKVAEVIRLLSKGVSEREIVKRLGISKGTVNNIKSGRLK